MSFFRIFITLFHFNRTNWKAVALCFVTATVFWLFNALNKTYSTNLRFPLQFEFDQTRFAPAANLPKNVTINVSRNGWDLVRKTFGVKLPVLSIPLEQPTETKRINVTALPSLFASQLGDLQINFIAADTLRINIDTRVSRKFKLIAHDESLTYRDDLGRTSPIVILPDSVELTGPESLVKNVPDSIVIALPPKKVGEVYREEVEVLIPNIELIKRNPPVVEARFDVNEFTSIRGRIRVERPVLPWGLVLEDDSLSIVLRMPRENVTTFSWNELSATLPPSMLPLENLPKAEVRKVFPEVKGLRNYTFVEHLDSIQLKQH
jgi:hypothetical protein